MHDWKKLVRKRVRAANLDPIRENEIVEELAQHLEDCYRECIADGASASQATRATLDELSHRQKLVGELARLELPYRETIVYGTPGGTNMMMNLVQDLRYGFR